MFKQNILKTKKIATKFLSWFLLVALLPLFFFGYLNYSNFSKSLNNEVMKGLIAIADNKVHHIETYILERERDAVVISHASDVISAMEKLENIAKKFGMDSPHYLAVDKQLRKSFTGINEIYGLHDIFLITLNGDVIFTVAKEDDYGTNLKTGSYKDSELAKSFTRTRTLIETAISDFDFYDPSNQPAAFISAPILKKKNLIGVLALQLKTKEIYSLAKDYNGLGETGETVLAMQRGDEAVFVAPTRHDPVAAFGQKIALGSQKAAPIQEAIRGRRGSGKSIDYRDTEVLAVWRYLPHLRWGIVIKIDTEEAFAAALNLRNWSLILGIMAVLIVIVLSLLVSKSISNPIIKLTQTTKLIAGGDLTSRINIASDDEIGQLGDAFNKMVEDLKSSQNRLVDRSRQLAVSNEQLQQEITERKQAEEELAKLATAIKQAHETVMILGTDGIVTYVNPALEKQMGYSSSELIGKSLISFDRRPDQKNIFQKAWETINKGNIWAGHMSPTSKEGSIREFDVTVSPIRDSSGKITSFVSIARNVTKELEMEERLHRAEKMEAIGTLAGGVAHDLNNVLGGIVGYPDLLLHDISEDSPMRSSLLAIKQSGQRAAAIVQDLLTLARRGVQVTKVVNLNTILTTSLKSVEYKKNEESHPDIKVETNLGKDLLNILGSPVHLSKTIINLLSNAIEAMPGDGKITISSENRYLDKPIKGYDNIKEGDYVVLSIKDTGIGIAIEDQKKIFEPFYTKKVMGRSGTGLGMAVVWGTVKDHQGYVDVKSIEGQGTTFILYFPATREEMQGVKEPVSIEEYSGKGEKILVVDDVEAQRDIATDLLKKLNYTVEAVASGEEALEYLKNNTADLLVLDMIMDSGIDGLDTYKSIIEIHPGQKAIIASGFSETDRVREVQKLGAGPYIRKPYALEKIGLAVKAELERR